MRDPRVRDVPMPLHRPRGSAFVRGSLLLVILRSVPHVNFYFENFGKTTRCKHESAWDVA